MKIMLSTRNNHTAFSDVLMQWYSTHKRNLPWREENDPYYIWLSEVILQQTRIEQGLAYYQKFIKNYPNVNKLAQANEEDVLRLWQGLGYYSRAKNLHKAAKVIVFEMNGIFPQSYNELLKLPGVGKYTAAAISSIAYKESVPVVDGNVYRLVSRYLGETTDISSSKAYNTFSLLVSELMHKKPPGEFNQAMMDFGSLQCKPKKPNCANCCLNQKCYAYGKKQVNSFPIKTKKVKIKKRYFYYLITEKEGKLAMKRRVASDIWSGLYDFPMKEMSIDLKTEEILNKLGYRDNQVIKVSEKIRHKLTHQLITTTFIHLAPDAPLEDKDINFYSMEQIDALPKPTLVDNYFKQMIF